MKRTLEKLLPRGRLRRGVFMLAGGTAAGQGFVLLAAPLLTRLYTPEDFGVLGVFSALLGLLGLAVCLRYDLAVPLAEDERTMVNLMALAGLAALLVSSLAGLALLGFSAPLVRLLDAQALAPWLWLLPPALLAIGLLNTLNHWAVRRAAFGRIMRTRLAQGIGQAVTPVVLGLAVSGPFGLLVGQIIGQTAGFGTHAYHFLRHERHLLGEVTARGILAAAAAYHRFATYGASGALLSGGSRLLPALLFAAIYGVEVAGLFVLTRRVLATPLQLLGVAVSQVYLSEAPRLAHENRPAMARLFMRTTWRLLAVASAVALVVVVAGPALFGLVFGAVWTEAGVFARFLALMYLAQLVVNPTSQTLTVLGRQDLLLLWEAVRLGAVLLVFAAAAELAWPPLRTVIMLSGVVSASYLLLFLLTRRRLGAATPHAA